MKHKAGLVFLVTAASLVVFFTGKVVLDMLYNGYDDIINPLAAQYGVPVSWVKAVIGQESSFRVNPPVRAGDETYGLMQMSPATAYGLGFEGTIPDDLIVPENNIALGIALIAQIRGSVGSDFRAMYSKYNSGSATKYLTSPQVADDVNKAVAWLAKFQGA